MNNEITLELIEERVPYEYDLHHEEASARSVGEERLYIHKALEKELSELQYHVSRFASEGATLRQINRYKIVVEYAKYLYEQRDTYKCAKVSTMLKLFFGLDITFFSLIPELAYEVKEKGPIPFERLVGTARRHLKPDTNRRR